MVSVSSEYCLLIYAVWKSVLSFYSAVANKTLLMLDLAEACSKCLLSTELTFSAIYVTITSSFY